MAGTILLSEAESGTSDVISTGPWDACFSAQGGLVLGSTLLLAGGPGAGKSTLTLQAANTVCETTGREVVYIAAEERCKDIRNRAERLRLTFLHRIRMVPYLEGHKGDFGGVLLASKPALAIIDSLAGITGKDHDAGLELCVRLKDYAVALDAPIVILDHVTKDEAIAGLMAKQHAVDTLITFFPHEEGSDQRLMKVIKNRNGPNTEACFEMTERGVIPCPGCFYCGEED